VLSSLSPDGFEVARALTLFGKGEPESSPRATELDHSSLNDSQRAAVQLCSDRSLAFVWGPPGTGKTRTLAHVVRELLAQQKRLLLVSTTNAAVDQALGQIAREADAAEAIARGEIVRIGRTDGETHGAGLREAVQRVHAARAEPLARLRARHRDVGAFLRRLQTARERLAASDPGPQASLFADEERPALRAADLQGPFSDVRARNLTRLPRAQLSRLLDRRHARLSQLQSLCRAAIDAHDRALRADEADLVKGARAVLATLTGAYFSPLLEGQRFDVVIVEEASMAILPTLFYTACLAREKTIMVGDPRQLPPIVQSSDPLVQRAMGRSIFEVTVPEPHRSPHVVMLDTQYRMHPRIGDLVSGLFYEGRLRHGEGTEIRDQIAARAPYPGEPLVVVDTAGGANCETRAGSSSRLNAATAELCVKLALEATDSGAESVAVITPYADQARDIRARLRRAGRGGQDGRIECSTVHRFQGHERDLVIFDTVDAAPMRPGVLLNDDRAGSSARNLVNVSLSRARGKLIIVSDVGYFEQEAPRSVITEALARMRAADAPVRRELG
jgi:superfamily I DNA and/or RNA helicase